jgi:RNase P subunit RPR2
MNRRSFLALAGITPLLSLSEVTAEEVTAEEVTAKEALEIPPIFKTPMCPYCNIPMIRISGSGISENDTQRRFRCNRCAHPLMMRWYTPGELRAAAAALEFENPVCDDSRRGSRKGYVPLNEFSTSVT